MKGPFRLVPWLNRVHNPQEFNVLQGPMITLLRINHKV
jgi:hypothetical protein